MKIDDIKEIEVGRYLTVDYGRLLLKNGRNTVDILDGMMFKSNDTAKKLGTLLHRIYGDHLDWIRHSTWLSKIQQIHMDEPERYRIGDILDELLNLNKKFLTLEDYKQCELIVDQRRKK